MGEEAIASYAYYSKQEREQKQKLSEYIVKLVLGDEIVHLRNGDEKLLPVARRGGIAVAAEPLQLRSHAEASPPPPPPPSASESASASHLQSSWQYPEPHQYKQTKRSTRQAAARREEGSLFCPPKI